MCPVDTSVSLLKVGADKHFSHQGLTGLSGRVTSSDQMLVVLVCDRLFVQIGRNECFVHFVFFFQA